MEKIDKVVLDGVKRRVEREIKLYKEAGCVIKGRRKVRKSEWYIMVEVGNHEFFFNHDGSYDGHGCMVG
jgi:hypothetical protein